jgi:hypothetical protein
MARRKKSNIATADKEWPGDLGQPIVVPFRGMPGYRSWVSMLEGKPEDIDPSSPEYVSHFAIIARDGLAERIEKLFRLADHYKIERKGDPGWGFMLAFALACDLHPGFQPVYDDWQATYFKTIFGFTPVYRTKEVDDPPHRRKGTGWAPMYSPEMLAILVDTFGKELKERGISDERFCELIAISVDPDLEKPSRRSEKTSKALTLVGRLSKGRKLLKKG